MTGARAAFAIPAVSLIVALAVAACSPSVPPSASPIAALPTPEPTPSATATATPRPSTPLPTEVPLPVVFVPESDSLAAGLLYRCDGPAFPIEILEGPSFELDDPGSAGHYLRMVNPSWLPDGTTWWLTHSEPGLLDYVGVNLDGSYEHARLEDDFGVYQGHSVGGCEPDAWIAEARPGFYRLPWWIPKARWPSADDRVLRVNARDFCPDTLAGRVGEPIIRYGDDAILIIPGSIEDPNPTPACGDDQVTTITLRLDEPVGDRELLDGSEWPPRDAHIPTDPLVFTGG